MVIAYLMRRSKQSYPETLNRVLVHRKRVMPNIGFQIQLRAFGKYKWDTSLEYSNELVDIKREIQTALKNLAHQVSRLQLDIRSSEKIFVTFDPVNLEQPRLVRIGLGNDDLSQYKKEWVLLVFLCHQFQLYGMRTLCTLREDMLSLQCAMDRDCSQQFHHHHTPYSRRNVCVHITRCLHCTHSFTKWPVGISTIWSRRLWRFLSQSTNKASRRRNCSFNV